MWGGVWKQSFRLFRQVVCCSSQVQVLGGLTVKLLDVQNFCSCESSAVTVLSSVFALMDESLAACLPAFICSGGGEGVIFCFLRAFLVWTSWCPAELCYYSFHLLSPVTVPVSCSAVAHRFHLTGKFQADFAAACKPLNGSSENWCNTINWSLGLQK